MVTENENKNIPSSPSECVEQVEVRSRLSHPRQDNNTQLLPKANWSGSGVSSSSLKSVGSTNSTIEDKASSKLRRGKWTGEEQQYVEQVIRDFNSGFLDAPAGTTLRSYLSAKLNCDPMRVTKKFTGGDSIGKKIYHPVSRNEHNKHLIDNAHSHLKVLEKQWRRRLELQQQEAIKKTLPAIEGPPPSQAGMSSGSLEISSLNSDGPIDNSVLTWLSSANAILKRPIDSSDNAVYSEETQQLFRNEMEKINHLINEGPAIRRATETKVGPASKPEADTTMFLSDSTAEAEVKKIHQGIPLKANSPVTSCQKRRRNNSSGAEDAEALVGFLKSVAGSYPSET